MFKTKLDGDRQGQAICRQGAHTIVLGGVTLEKAGPHSPEERGLSGFVAGRKNIDTGTKAGDLAALPEATIPGVGPGDT